MGQRASLPVHRARLARASLPGEQLGPATTGSAEMGMPVAVVQEVVERTCPRVRIEGRDEPGGVTGNFP